MDCIDCKWMKGLEDSDGNWIEFCMCTNGGNYLGETDIYGFCDLEDNTEAEGDA